jgi:hypothetical protein
MNRRNGNWLARSINQRTATAATVRATLSGSPSINGAAVRLSSRAPSPLPLPTHKSYGHSIDVCCRRRLKFLDAMPRGALFYSLARHLIYIGDHFKAHRRPIVRAAASPEQNDLSCSPRWGRFPFHLTAGKNYHGQLKTIPIEWSKRSWPKSPITYRVRRQR